MKEKTFVSIDVTNIIETFFNKFLVIQDKRVKPTFILSMMLTVPKDLDQPEYAIYEQLEGVLEYPDQLSSSEKINKYITELFDISNTHKSITEEIKKRVHVSYMNFLNSNLVSTQSEEMLLNVIMNSVDLDFYSFKKIGDNYFLIVSV